MKTESPEESVTICIQIIPCKFRFAVLFYSIPYSLSSKDDVLEFDTKISEDDMGGSSNSAGEFDLGTAVELLGLDDEDAKTQASRLQGAYMSFLLLRHLRLRDLQRSVRNAEF